MKKELRKDLLSLSNKLTEQIKGVKLDHDSQPIHELRTDFKKTRALLRWQKINKDIYQEIKNIYSIAGELRNIQVLQQMTETDQLMPGSFQNWLFIGSNKIKKQLIKTAYKKTCSRFYNKIQQINLRNRKNRLFFTSRINKIQQSLLIDPVADDQLHKIRKMIKDMQYVMEWWKKRIGKTKKLIKILTVKKLEFIAKQIGEYNDKRMLLISLTTYLQQERDLLLIKEISTEIDKWQIIKAAEKERLLAILRFEKIGL